MYHLTRKGLFDDFDQIEKEIARWMPQGDRVPFSRALSTNVKEFEDHYQYEIEVPGFKKEDINVEFVNGKLTVKAVKNEKKEEKDKEGKIIFEERSSGEMVRSFYLGNEIKPEEIEGKYEDGILTLKVPKKEKEDKKLIKID